MVSASEEEKYDLEVKLQNQDAEVGGIQLKMP